MSSQGFGSNAVFKRVFVAFGLLLTFLFVCNVTPLWAALQGSKKGVKKPAARRLNAQRGKRGVRRSVVSRVGAQKNKKRVVVASPVEPANVFKAQEDIKVTVEEPAATSLIGPIIIAGAMPGVKATVVPQAKQVEQVDVLVRVFPVTFDTKTAKWSLLLGFEADSVGALWSDFAAVIAQRSSVLVASSILKSETGGVFDVSQAHIAQLDSFSVSTAHGDDVVYFVPVTYVPAVTINKILHSNPGAVKAQVIWRSIDTLLADASKGPVQIVAGYGAGLFDAAVSYGTMNILSELWPKVKTTLKSGGVSGTLDKAPVVGQKKDPLAYQAQLLVKTPKFETELTMRYLMPQSGWVASAADSIFFYHKGQPFYEFANFWPAPIVIDGVHYPTTEHYFQSQKFPGNHLIQQEILKDPNPLNAYKTAAKYSAQARLDWSSDILRIQIMYRALVAKFTQNITLMDLLLSTGNKMIIENTRAISGGQHDDPFWGNGKADTGKNYLGRLLMYLRDEFKALSGQ